MPKSKVRKKSVYTPPEGVLQSRAAQARVAQPSPRWFAPLNAAKQDSVAIDPSTGQVTERSTVFGTMPSDRCGRPAIDSRCRS